MRDIMGNYIGMYKDGFYIRPMLQRVRKNQMDILLEIDSICKRHGLRWFADWGTLLGAIRHKGYIPWDDDLDISMFRLDFERFKKYAAKELPEDYCCCINRGAQMQDLVFCVNNGKNVNTDEIYLNAHYGCPYVVGVDIFVYDNIPDDEKERMDYLAMFSYTFAAAQEVKEEMFYDECSQELKNWMEISEKLTGRMIPRDIPLKGYLMTLADQIAAMYYDVDTKKVAIAGYLPWGEQYLFDAEWFRNISRYPFEDIAVYVPDGYDRVLERLYGKDYMVPKEYHEHDSDVLRQEKELQKWYLDRGQKIPDMFRE